MHELFIEHSMSQFKSYEEAMDFINRRIKDFPSKDAYYSSEEYKKIYPILNRLRKEALTFTSKKAKVAMKEVGAKEGDCVEYSVANPFGEIFVLEGKIKLDKLGIPYVHLAEPTTRGKKKIRWHKGFRSVRCIPKKTARPK